MMIRAAFLFLLLLTLPTLGSAGEKGPIVLKHDGWVAAVAFAPDGKTLASAGADNVVRLWEVETWKPSGVLKGHFDCICALAYSPDGSGLATGSFDRTAIMWDLEKKEVSWRSKKQKGAVTSVLLMDDEPRMPVLQIGGIDGTIQIYLPSGYAKAVFQHKSWVNCLVYRNGAGLASGSSDGTVSLPAGDKKSRTTLEGGAGEVRSVAFSPDGKLLAAGNRYGTVRVWDVASRKEVKTLTGHASDVWAIAFSPDGKTLAAADTDWKKPSKIKLWDTATWTERASLACPGEILCLAYSPNGDWLAAGSWDRTVRVFSLR